MTSSSMGCTFPLISIRLCIPWPTLPIRRPGGASRVTHWQMLDMLAQYGEDTWFRLGDRDLATHLLRTQWLAQGMTLTDDDGTPDDAR